MTGLRFIEGVERAVRQHAGAVAVERVAVLRALVFCAFSSKCSAERRLEVVDGRHVEHVEPHHRLLAGIAVVVRRPVRR